MKLHHYLTSAAALALVVSGAFFGSKALYPTEQCRVTGKMSGYYLRLEKEDGDQVVTLTSAEVFNSLRVGQLVDFDPCYKRVELPREE